MLSKEKIKEKNLRYPLAVFRVANETKQRLLELKGNQSWNLFFVELIKLKEKSDQPKK